MLSIKEVAEVFSISVREVWRKVDRGALPRPLKIGRLRRWLASEIQKVIELLKQQRDGGKGGAQ
jgi:predicted DNA-binding transcriptional regulator AlpA